MTGELTLTGRVLPIGGVKEKLLGAHRAGIREIVVPQESESHLEDIPDEVRSELTIHPVEDLDEVIAIALHPEDVGEPKSPTEEERELAHR